MNLWSVVWRVSIIANTDSPCIATALDFSLSFTDIVSEDRMHDSDGLSVKDFKCCLCETTEREGEYAVVDYTELCKRYIPEVAVSYGDISCVVEQQRPLTVSKMHSLNVNTTIPTKL